MKQIMIHPNTPPRLAQAFQKAGSFHKLAQELGVNVQIVHSLITKGIEPTDKTEKGRDVRHKLYLTKHKRQGHMPRRPLTPIQKAIRQMVKATNHSVLIVRTLRKSKEFNGEPQPSSTIREQYLSRVRATRH